jgi:hypothetical protein
MRQMTVRRLAQSWRQPSDRVSTAALRLQRWASGNRRWCSSGLGARVALGSPRRDDDHPRAFGQFHVGIQRAYQPVFDNACDRQRLRHSHLVRLHRHRHRIGGHIQRGQFRLRGNLLVANSTFTPFSESGKTRPGEPLVARAEYVAQKYTEAALAANGTRFFVPEQTRCRAQPLSAISRPVDEKGRKSLQDEDLRPTLANRGHCWRATLVPPRGNELSQFSQGNTGVLEQGGAESGALFDVSHIGGARGALADWLEACPVALDAETAAGILAMVRTAAGS